MGSAKRKYGAFVLLLVVAFLAVLPRVGKGGCRVHDSSFTSDDPMTTLGLSDTVDEGETNRHQFYVGSEVAYLEMYLNWGSTSDSLALTIYTPSGSTIGTFRDSSDGMMDGKIHIDIDPDGNYVDQETWTLDVYGEKVSSERSYTLNLYQH